MPRGTGDKLLALTLCINVYKYTSHLASLYIPDAPPTGPKLKGKRQQRDGQIDLGFAPNTPPMCWVWRQGGKGGPWVGVWVGGAGPETSAQIARVSRQLRKLAGRPPGPVSIRPCSCRWPWISPLGQLVGGPAQLVGGPSIVGRKRGRRRVTALSED